MDAREKKEHPAQNRARIRRASDAFNLILLLPVIWFLSACQTNYVLKGNRELQRGNYVDAQREFENAIRDAPYNAEGYAGAGIARFFVNESDPLPLLRKADSLAHNPGAWTFLRGVIASERGYLDESMEAFEKSKALPDLENYKDEIDDVIQALRIRQQIAHSKAAAPETGEEFISVSTLAVLPVASPDDDTLLALAALGLTDFLMTDFSKVKSITVVERLRLKEVFIELNRSPLEYDPRTLPRKGRLLHAERLVDASLMTVGKDLFISARILDTEDGKIAASTEEKGSEEEFFEMEKTVVLSLIERLRIPITAQERREILTPHTESLLAFFAYCRGLKDMDRMEYSSAVENFRQAVATDNNFELAAKRLREAESLNKPAGSLRHLLALLFPSSDAQIEEALIRTAGSLLESGFLNSGAARRDGPDVLPYPPNPK